MHVHTKTGQPEVCHWISAAMHPMCRLDSSINEEMTVRSQYVLCADVAGCNALARFHESQDRVLVAVSDSGATLMILLSWSSTVHAICLQACSPLLEDLTHHQPAC